MKNLTEPGKKADALFRKTGDKGIMLLIYLAGLTVHTLLALRMEMASVFPDEFAAASWAAVFSGGSVTGGGSVPGTGSFGWLGAVLYSPVMLIIGNPFARYKAMLIINGALISFMPVIAYNTAKKIGIDKAWHRLTAAFICGSYPAVFAHTKLIWSETLCYVFPWLTVYLLLTACDVKNRAAKHLFSVLSALVIAAAAPAHERMLSLIPAVIAVILFANFFLKKEIVCLSSFFPSLIVFITAFFLLTATLLKTAGFGFPSRILAKPDADLILELTAGHLYYFAAATWGFGILGICLFIYACFERRPPTKPHKKNAGELRAERFIIFSAFASAAMLFGGAASVVSRLNSAADGNYSQDGLIFGRYTDNLIPLVLMLTMCYVFMYGLTLRKLLTAVVALGVIFTSFFVFTAGRLVNIKEFDALSVVSLGPLRIGEKIGGLITVNGLFLTVSSVFCVMALFIVFVCCSGKRRIRILTLSAALIAAYSCLYTAFAYLPYRAEETRRENSPVYELERYIFDSADAPPLVAFKLPQRTAALLGFLNRNSRLVMTDNAGEIPENCFIALDKSVWEFPFETDTELIMIGETEKYRVWALGEKAIAYALSQE